MSQEDRVMKRSWLALAVGLALSLAASELGWLSDNVRKAVASQQPSHGVLVPVADMSAGRAAHTATALPDGRVLVAGGFAQENSAKGAEVYQPGTGRFSPLPPMITSRHSHTATLLRDGRVLIAGGYGEGTTTLATAELFN